MSLSVMAVFGCSAQSVKAEQTSQLTGAEFLEWERDSQVFYIGVSVGMASLIASRNDSEQATCIDDWYKLDAEASYDFILAAVQDYPTYHPRGVILGVLQKRCGSFSYRPKN